MNRNDLIIHLTALAEETERSGERDIALVLFQFVLAIGEKTDAKPACSIALFQPPPGAPKVSTA